MEEPRAKAPTVHFPEAHPEVPAPAGHPAPAANLGDHSPKPRLICTCCRLDLTPWLGWAPPGHGWVPGPLTLTRHAPTSSDPPGAPRTEALGRMRDPQCSAGTEGVGRPGQGSGGGGPLPRLGRPAGFAVVTVPGLPVPAVRQRPPTQRGHSCRGCPRRGSASRARALSLRPALCFLPVPLKKRKRKRKKKRKKLLRDDSELFAKVPFIVMQRGHPSPPGRKDVQRVLRPCLAVALSRVPYPTGALPRGDVPLPRGRQPPVGPSPSTPNAICEGLGEQDGASGDLGQLWRGRGVRLGGKRPAAPWP